MANILKLKRSAVAARVPTTSDLDLGELAVNTHDGRLFLKKDNGTASIVDVTAANATGSTDRRRRYCSHPRTEGDDCRAVRLHDYKLDPDG